MDKDFIKYFKSQHLRDVKANREMKNQLWMQIVMTLFELLNQAPPGLTDQFIEDEDVWLDDISLLKDMDFENLTYENTDTGEILTVEIENEVEQDVIEHIISEYTEYIKKQITKLVVEAGGKPSDDVRGAFAYQAIFYNGDRSVDANAEINYTEYYAEVPDTTVIERMFTVLGANYAEIYYDAYHNGDYDKFVCSYNDDTGHTSYVEPEKKEE